MPIIIESYDQPYTKIAEKFFPGKPFKLLETPVSDDNDELFYFVRQEKDNIPLLTYYFSKIFYFEAGKIVCIDKISQKIKYYDINTGKLIKFREEKREETKSIDKTEFLPQLHAQNGEIVIFPEEDDE